MLLLLNPTYLVLLVFTVLFALAAGITGVLFVRALLKYLRHKHTASEEPAPEEIEAGIKRQDSGSGSG